MTAVAQVEETNGKRLGRLSRWEPKKWKPIYDQILLLHISGRNNVEIGSALGLTKMQVGNVINSQAGQALVTAYRAKVVEDTTDVIKPMLQAIAIEGTRQMKKVLTDPKTYKDQPLGAVDRVMKVLSAIGQVNEDGINENGSGGDSSIFAGEIGERIAETLKMISAPEPRVGGTYEGKNTLKDEHKLMEIPEEKLKRLEGN